MKKNTKKIITGAVFAAVFLLIATVIGLRIAGTDDNSAVTPSKTEKVYKVSVIEVSPTGNNVFMNYTGIVQSGVMEQAAFSSVGTVKKIYVSEGDEVKAGDLLAEIDDTDARRQVDNAKNSLQIANTNLQSSINQRQNAYDAYLEASRPDEAKKNLDNAIQRRDAQQQKVDRLAAELVEAEAHQERTKNEYEHAGKEFSEAQNNVTSLSTQLAVLKESPTATQEEIDEKQAELDAAVADKDVKEAVYNEKRTAYSTAQVDYRAKQTELDAARGTLATYNEAVDTAQQN